MRISAMSSVCGHQVVTRKVLQLAVHLAHEVKADGLHYMATWLVSYARRRQRHLVRYCAHCTPSCLGNVSSSPAAVSIEYNLFSVEWSLTPVHA